VPGGSGFRRRKDASASLVQMRGKSQKAFANHGVIGHRDGVAIPTALREMAIHTDERNAIQLSSDGP